MANLLAFPSNDVNNMLDLAGYTPFEVEAYWTDELLAAKMAEYYDGTLTNVVNPAQGIRPEQASVWANFLAETQGDLAGFVEGIGSGAVKITSNLALAAIGVLAIVLLLKSK